MADACSSAALASVKGKCRERYFPQNKHLEENECGRCWLFLETLIAAGSATGSSNGLEQSLFSAGLKEI